MDISNLYLLKRKGYEIFSQVALKLVDLEINKGITDGYLWALHGDQRNKHACC